MALIDLNPHAEQCRQDNISAEKAYFHIGDAKVYLEDKQDIDLLVCNPPYIPRP